MEALYKCVWYSQTLLYWNTKCVASYRAMYIPFCLVNLFLTVDCIIEIVANTVMFLCGQVTYIRRRQTDPSVLIEWRHWPETFGKNSTHFRQQECCIFVVAFHRISLSVLCEVLIIQKLYELAATYEILTKHAASHSIFLSILRLRSDFNIILFVNSLSYISY
jgi:hypothetical protein